MTSWRNGLASETRLSTPFMKILATPLVSALVAILSSSTSVSKDNTGTEECLCRDNLYFCAPEAVTTAKWRDVLERV